MTKHARFEHMKEAQKELDHQMAMSASSLQYDPNEETTELSAAGTLLRLLEKFKASDIPKSAKRADVVEISSSLKPLESAQVLWSHNILGAPVWDGKTNKYVGFFDMRDLLSTVLVARQKKVANVKFTDSWFPGDVGTTGPTTTYLAARNPFTAKYTGDTTLLDLSKALTEKNCHRIPLVDPETKRCTRIISQSALVKFLADHVSNHHPALLISLEEAGFDYKKEVVSCPDTASANDVFQLMDQHRLSGIAIVDAESGKLVGNTSATDIKLVVTAEEEGIAAELDQMDIMSFLAAARAVDEDKEKDRYPSSHVFEDSTVLHAIKFLAKTGYHRVFVCEKANHKPVGVISVTDVIRFVVEKGKDGEGNPV